jgi:hypothetical protein
LHRPRRSIETFDIALMAVVTKAMGAFLVLMLIMLPSYNKVPGMQTEVHDADAALQRVTERVAALEQRKAVLQQRVVVRRPKSGAPPAPGGTIVSLLLTFSWSRCDLSTVGFYARGENVTLADGSKWPAVKLGEQDAPPGVVAYVGAQSAKRAPQNKADASRPVADPHKLGALLFQVVNLLGNEGYWPEYEFSQTAKHQILWLINNLRPGAKFAIYAKPVNLTANLTADCHPHVGAIVPEASAPNADSPAWNHWVLSPGRSGSVVHLGYVIWTGRELRTVDPTLANQAQLDAQLDWQGENIKKSNESR